MHTNKRRTGILALPPELLFDILALSSSSNLPLANKHLLYTFKHTPPSSRARFILGQVKHLLLDTFTPPATQQLLEHALSYPICTPAVLETLERIPPLVSVQSSLVKCTRVSPPRWLFRHLQSQTQPKRRRKPGSVFATPQPSSTDLRANPLPFLEFLNNRYTLEFTPRTSAFALAMTVRAGPFQHPLLRFLLRAGADPSAHSCFPLQIAATLGDLDALKAMIEPSSTEVETQEGKATGGKRRRVEDRVQPNTKVLFAAVKAKHIGVAEWLMREKGVVPDMATVQILQIA